MKTILAIIGVIFIGVVCYHIGKHYERHHLIAEFMDTLDEMEGPVEEQ